MIRAIVLLFCNIFFNPRISDENRLIQYFIDNKTTHFMVQDRASDKDTISVAATGFGFYAWSVAAQRNIITKQEAVKWINKSLDNVERLTPRKNRGWLYHFMDAAGQPKFNKEVSSVDTAIFYLGAKVAAINLGDESLKKRIEESVKSIDVNWMMDGKYIRHGLIWDGDTPKFFSTCWDEYNEGVMIYRLFNKPFEPAKTKLDLPLFVYYYPLCFYEDQQMKKVLVQAVDYQIKHYGYCGVTACDGPNGYTVNDRDVVSPLALWAASSWSPAARRSLDATGRPRILHAYSRNTAWTAKDRIGIDEGAALMCVLKGHSAIWNLLLTYWICHHEVGTQPR